MDALTHLIQLARPQASLELRCQLKGNFTHSECVVAGSCAISSCAWR